LSLPQIGQQQYTHRENRHRNNNQDGQEVHDSPTEDEGTWRPQENTEDRELFQGSLVETLKTYVKATHEGSLPAKATKDSVHEELTVSAQQQHAQYLQTRIDQAVQRGDYSTDNNRPKHDQGSDWYDNFDSDED
jgi:hypothetical protein